MRNALITQLSYPALTSRSAFCLHLETKTKKGFTTICLFLNNIQKHEERKRFSEKEMFIVLVFQEEQNPPNFPILSSCYDGNVVTQSVIQAELDHREQQVVFTVSSLHSLSAFKTHHLSQKHLHISAPFLLASL